jgi:hypothetical protein
LTHKSRIDLNNSIEAVVERIARDVPGAYCYVFDSTDKRFIYKSSDNDQLEKVILSLDKERGLDNLINESPINLVLLDCQDTNRKFLVKKLASDVFFGMCVDQKPEIIEKAREVMFAPFKDSKS